MITAGSVLFAGIVSPGLDTIPIFVSIPVLVVVVAFTIISERLVPADIGALVEHENELEPIFGLHVHGDVFATDTRVVPRGRVSVIVVTPLAVAGHSFDTMSV